MEPVDGAVAEEALGGAPEAASERALEEASEEASDDASALIADAAAIFRALGDEHRLRILEFIASGDRSCCATEAGVCACDLQAVTGLSQPTVSHHMKVLADAGLVRAEKLGRWMYYSVDADGVARAMRVLGGFRSPTTAG